MRMRGFWGPREPTRRRVLSQILKIGFSSKSFLLIERKPQESLALINILFVFASIRGRDMAAARNGWRECTGKAAGTKQ